MTAITIKQNTVKKINGSLSLCGSFVSNAKQIADKIIVKIAAPKTA
tara:strand:- start:392 stop:529 length:138 start_codon:yes stop_codon:yes gene_type:complete